MTETTLSSLSKRSVRSSPPERPRAASNQAQSDEGVRCVRDAAWINSVRWS